MADKTVIIPPYTAPGVGQYAVADETNGLKFRVSGKFAYVTSPGGREVKLDQAGVFDLTRACKAAFQMVT